MFRDAVGERTALVHVRLQACGHEATNAFLHHELEIFLVWRWKTNVVRLSCTREVDVVHLPPDVSAPPSSVQAP